MTRLSVRYFSDRIEVIDSDGFFGPSWMTIGQEQLRGAKPGDLMTVTRHGKSITFPLIEPKDTEKRYSVGEYYGHRALRETPRELAERWRKKGPPGWNNMTEDEQLAQARKVLEHDGRLRQEDEPRHRGVIRGRPRGRR